MAAKCGAARRSIQGRTFPKGTTTARAPSTVPSASEIGNPSTGGRRQKAESRRRIEDDPRHFHLDGLDQRGDPARGAARDDHPPHLR